MMSRDDPMTPMPKSRWKMVSVIAIIVIFVVVFAINFAGWEMRPFGSTFRSQQPQPTETTTPPPLKK